MPPNAAHTARRLRPVAGFSQVRNSPVLCADLVRSLALEGLLTLVRDPAPSGAGAAPDAGGGAAASARGHFLRQLHLQLAPAALAAGEGEGEGGGEGEGEGEGEGDGDDDEGDGGDGNGAVAVAAAAAAALPAALRCEICGDFFPRGESKQLKKGGGRCCAKCTSAAHALRRPEAWSPELLAPRPRDNARGGRRGRRHKHADAAEDE